MLDTNIAIKLRQEGATFAFTVFTPTYNRKCTLERVYASLKAQTFRDFEWLIVDDGSTDGTRALVEGWIAEEPFPVRYLWQPNAHKKTAFNHGVREARGLLFLPLDSDDSCVPEALERFWWHWCNIPEVARRRFSAVTCLCLDEAGQIVGHRFPHGPEGDWIDSDSMEIRHRWRVGGEKWGFHRTEVLRRFPIPDNTAGMVPEGIIWAAIAAEYKTRFVNEALRVYHQDAAKMGGAGQITGKGGLDRNAPGLLLWMQSVLTVEIDWFWWNPGWFARCAANHTRFALLAGRNPLRETSALANPLSRALVALAAPAGVAFWALDRTLFRSDRGPSC